MVGLASGARPAAAAGVEPRSPTFVELPGERYYVIPAADLAQFAVKTPVFDAAMETQFSREAAAAQITQASSSGDATPPPPPRSTVAMGVRG